jgi:hypothetical protein
MAMADSTTQNPGAGSKAADEALIEAIREANFQGDAWDRFAGELARYGIPFVGSWIASLKMFVKCAEQTVGCPGPPHNIQLLSEDEASAMANEIIARALNTFRDSVLRPGRGSPAGRVSLNVMFIAQCILQFPNVYRHWQIEKKRLRADDPYDGLEEMEFMVSSPDGDPAGLVMIREEIAHALEHYVKDRRVKHAFLPWGYSRGESGVMLGVTEKALDEVQRNHWKTLRGRPDGLDGGGGEGTAAP